MNPISGSQDRHETVVQTGVNIGYPPQPDASSLPIMQVSMSEKIYNVLFLCVGNSARSIMAECALSRYGIGRFRAYSAGSHPRGEVHPLTLQLLQRLNYRADHLRSKSWDEFLVPEAPSFDFVFTVCDATAREACPVFPGQPMTAHWGVEDPVAPVGPEDKMMKAFRRAYVELESRVKVFASLRLDGLDRLALQGRLKSIGQSQAPGEVTE
jgi:arsenate reductase